MAVERAVYRPRQPERGVLHAVVRTHLEAFLREAAHRADGAGLPQFVEQEFREFLTCGVLAHGFARLRCDSCALERLVPFSCKGRLLPELRGPAHDRARRAPRGRRAAPRPRAAVGP
ncbi:MAG: transposase zinc-binding domain-containing protein, partial [Dehalococcoidia bacterium]|nr:transposase zinc-binding domain-containing protein [Dehalococcoidia bacterium]